MSKPIRPIKVLLYEDKKEYQDSFKVAARAERIITEVVDNVEDLLETIKDNPKKYQFIVLDARAYLKEGQQEGTEDEMNLLTIIQELDRLKYTATLNIPYCINTGFADLKLRLGGKVNCPIYEKGDEENLFAYIWETYNNTHIAKLHLSHPEIFGFVHDHFADAEYDVVVALFHNEAYKSAQISDRVNHLNVLRRTAEHLMDILHDRFLGGAPGIVTQLGRRLGEITDHISANGDMPVHVYGILTNIRKTAGTYGSHTPTKQEEIETFPSDAYVAGLAMSLKDVFAWAQTKV